MDLHDLKKSGITKDTPKNLLLGAGTIYKNLAFKTAENKWQGEIIGATSGGSKLSIVPEIVNIDIDGASVKVKGLTQKLGESAKIEVNLVEVTPDSLKMAIIGKTQTSDVTGYDLIATKPLIEDNSYRLSSDREFEVQTSYLRIINMLLEEMNYQKLKYNLNGVATMMPILSNLERPIDFTFINTNFSVLDRDISITYDTFNVPNVFVGTVDNPDLDTTYYAKVINDDPTSKYSTASIGREIPVFFTPENIVNQATLVHFLEHKKSQSIFKIETVKIKIAITPNMFAGAKVFLKNDKIEGIFIVKKWSLELTHAGLMDLTLEREVHNV